MAKASLQSIMSTLNDLTTDELMSLNRFLIQVVKQRRSFNQMHAAIAFRVGDKVQWTSTRTGQTMTGVVKKVKRVNILVDTSHGLWNVTSTLLKKA